MNNKTMGIISKIFFLSIMAIIIYSNNVFAGYSESDLQLNVGEIYDATQYISDFDEVISVLSGDSSVAKVDSNGVITAIKPGTNVIIITYLDTGGSTSEIEFNVTVELKTGYYRIKNKETGEYLAISNIKSKLDPSLCLTNYSESGDSKLCQVWNVIEQNDTYYIKPYTDEYASVSYNMVYNDIRIERLMSYAFNEKEIYDQLRSWYVAGDKIYNRYGGVVGQVYKGKRLSRSTFSSSTYTIDTWIFEPVNEITSGIRLIDEYYYSNIVNDRFMAVYSEKSLDDLKIRCLRYNNAELEEPIWSSSNANIASVDPVTGKVTANNPGSAVITVTQPGLLTNNKFSYTIKVLPLKDGVYSITNKLGFDKLEVVEQSGVYYLARSNNSSSNSLWYLQTTISGKYLISIVDDKRVGSNFVLGSNTIVKDNISSTYATLGLLRNDSSYVPTWNIRNNDLGYSLELDSESSSSMFILDASDSKVELGLIDYEDYEGMWDVNEVIETTNTKKIYIHPYYDDKFVSLFPTHTKALDNINSYLEYVEATLESEFDLQVEVLAPSEMYTGGISDLNNGSEYRSELSKLFASAEEADPYHRYIHKYIIYSGHNFTNNGSDNASDISLICSYDMFSDDEAMMFTSLHEISHSLSARDHYHNGEGCSYGGRCTTCGTLELKRAEHCVLHYSTYDKENPYCNECKMEIIASINARCVE